MELWVWSLLDGVDIVSSGSDIRLIKEVIYEK